MATNNEIGIKLILSGEQQVKTALSGVEDRMDRLTGAVSRAGHYGAAFLSITQGLVPVAQAAVRAADAVTTLNNQLKLSTGSTQAATKAYAALFDIAQSSRVSFIELGGTFASISRAGQELGLSQQRLLGVTEAIGNAMTISGGNAESMNAALVQLGQGLASGTLRGEELNSIMEQTPRLAKAIADGLGVPIGKLRDMGAAGEISAQQVIRALEAQSAVLRGEVAGSVLTVGQAMTQLQNAAIKTVGDLDEATGASSSLASSISVLAAGIGTLGQVAKDNEVAIKAVLGGLAVGAAIGGSAALAANIGKITVAVRLLGATLAAHPVVLALMGLGTLYAGVSAAAEAKSKTLDGMRATLRELESLEKRGNTAMYGTKVSDEVIAKRREEIKRLRGEIALLDSTNLDTRAEDARMAAMVNSAKAANADREAYANLSRTLSGFKGNYKEYTDNVALINRLRDIGSISEKEAAQRLGELAKQHGLAAKEVKANKDAERELAEQRKNDLKVGELRNQQIDERLKFEAELAKQQAAVVAQEFESADATNAQALARELANDKTVDATLAMQQLTLAQLEQQRLDLEATDNVIPGYIQALEARIAAQKRLIAATQTGINQKPIDDAAKETIDAWRKAVDKIEDALTDALMRGFESGKDFGRNLVDTLKNMFSTLVLRPVIQAVINPVIGALSSTLTLSGAANAGQAGSSGGFSLAGAASNAYSILTTGVRGSIANGFTKLASTEYGQKLGLYDADAGVRGLTESGQAVSGTLQSAGSAMTAYSISKMLSGEYKIGNGKIMDALTAVAGWFDPTGGLVTGAISGALNRAFGMGAKNVQDTGLSGTLSGSGADLKQYADWNQKGGWLRSDKSGTNYSSLSLELGQLLDQSVQSIRNATAVYADSIGLSASAIEGYSQSVRLSLKGLDEAAQQKAITDMLAGFGTGMVKQAFGPALSAFMRTGETMDVTLSRLSGALTGVNGMLGTLGQSLYSVSVAGADMASQLVDLFGGMEPMLAKTSSYYQNFYTESERAAQATLQLTQSLSSMGLKLPETRDGWRDLVEAQDLTTASGRATYTALIGLSDAFAALTPSMDDVASAVQGLLGSLNDAITSSRTAVAEARASIGSSQKTLNYADLVKQVGGINVSPPSRDALDKARSSLSSAQLDVDYRRKYLEGGFTTLADEYNSQTGWDVISFVKTPLQKTQINVAASVNGAEKSLQAAQTILYAAKDNLTKVEEAYTASMKKWVETSNFSVATLNSLRESTLDYYKQQEELAGLMLSSAANLRSAVQMARLDTMTGAQSLQNRLSDYDKTYSLALSTTGSVKAGYADQLAAVLPQLSRDLMSQSASRADWTVAVAKLSAKSQVIADQLEASAPKDYQAEANTLLGLIDAKLFSLNEAAKQSEYALKNAVTDGAARTANGLQQVINQLQGKTVSAFATGGTFRNGVVDTPTMAPMALFGEAGPEAIMPLARGPGGMLGVRMHGGSGQGDSGSSASEHLLRSLVDEVRRLSVDLQATKQEISGMRRDNNIGNAEIAASTKKVARLQEKFEAVGMPTIPA